MSAVSRLLGRLVDFGLNAEWYCMGGNNMVIRVTFGRSVEALYGTSAVVISDREDTFSRADWYDDAQVWGFFVRAYKLDPEGCELDDDDSAGWLYCTNDDAGLPRAMADMGERVVDLEDELGQAFYAIRDAVNAGSVGGIALSRG